METALSVILDGYSVVIGSYLGVTVPQSCVVIEMIDSNRITQLVIGVNTITALVLFAYFTIKYGKIYLMKVHTDTDIDTVANIESLKECHSVFYIIAVITAITNIIVSGTCTAPCQGFQPITYVTNSMLLLLRIGLSTRHIITLE